MSRKLNVEELESRIAPSVGLSNFLQQLGQSDSAAAAMINQFVNPDGSVDVAGATSAWNSAGGSQISPTQGSFNVTNNTVLSDRTAQSILNAFAARR